MILLLQALRAFLPLPALLCIARLVIDSLVICSEQFMIRHNVNCEEVNPYAKYKVSTRRLIRETFSPCARALLLYQVPDPAQPELDTRLTPSVAKTHSMGQGPSSLGGCLETEICLFTEWTAAAS